MENPIIGKCPRCGVGTAQLFPPQYQVLVDNGQQVMTCLECQESAVAKHTQQLLREVDETVKDPAKRKVATAEAQAKARAKVAEPAEEKPAPAPQPKAEVKPAAKSEPAN